MGWGEQLGDQPPIYSLPKWLVSTLTPPAFWPTTSRFRQAFVCKNRPMAEVERTYDVAEVICQPPLAGIAGRPRSGKSTLARWLASIWPRPCNKTSLRCRLSLTTSTPHPRRHVYGFISLGITRLPVLAHLGEIMPPPAGRQEGEDKELLMAHYLHRQFGQCGARQHTFLRPYSGLPSGGATNLYFGWLG